MIKFTASLPYRGFLIGFAIENGHCYALIRLTNGEDHSCLSRSRTLDEAFRAARYAIDGLLPS